MSYLPGTTYVQLNSNQGASITDVNSNVYSYNSGFPNYTYTNSTASLNINFSNSTNVTKVVFGSNVTSIQAKALYRCTALTSVTIPASVISIGNQAFRESTSLTTLDISAQATNLNNIGEQAFYGISIQNINIPGTNVFCGGGCFANCLQLRTVTFTTLTGLGDDLVFYGCKAITSYTITNPGSNYSTLDGNLYNGNKTTFINYAIGKQETSFTIPNGVLTINDGIAFQFNTSLTTVTIPNGVTYIDSNSFQYCTSLTTMSFPASVTSIGDYCFESCRKLINVSVYSNQKVNVGTRTFYGIGRNGTLYTTLANTPSTNNDLTKYFTTIYYITTCIQVNSNQGSAITDQNGNIYTYNSSFPNYTYVNSSSIASLNTIKFQNNTTITKVILGSNITSISASAFQGCSLLATITLPTTSITIASTSNAFTGIATSVTIDGLLSTTKSSIPANMFYGNTTMTGITIGANVTSIDTTAFQSCSALTTVTVSSTQIVTTATNAFTGISQPATLYTTPANIYNISLTQYFTNTYLIGTGPTNYYTIQFGEKKDLSVVFTPLTSTSAVASGFLVKNYNGTGLTKDLSEIFEPYTTGAQAQATNFLVENYNGSGVTKDLNLIFKPI